MKIVFLGNCQARPLADLVQTLSDEITVTKVGIVHLLKDTNEPEFHDAFHDADFIVAQQVAENYPCKFITGKRLAQTHGAKLVPIVNLYYSGYHPDLTYFRLETGTLKGPVGEYHFKSIANSWAAGESVEACSLKLTSGVDGIDECRAASNQSLKELARREQSAAVCITDFIQENLHLAPLFHTMNHPTKLLLQEYASRIFQRLTGKVTQAPKNQESREPLGQFRVPLTPNVKAALGLEFSGPAAFHGLKEIISDTGSVSFKSPHVYSVDDLIQSYYRVYDLASDALRKKLSANGAKPSPL